MALADSVTLTFSAAFCDKVKAATVKTAIAVQAEDPETANHAERSALAYAILHAQDALIPEFALAVALNPTVLAGGEQAPDNDVEFAIASLWDAFAAGG